MARASQGLLYISEKSSNNTELLGGQNQASDLMLAVNCLVVKS
jgi:hypothetical protein